MASGHVLLLTLPWEQLEHPSIQLGILSAVLEREGIPVETRSLNLEFMEHCAIGGGLTPASYHAVVEWAREVSLGDWIFASPAESDGAYLDFLRGSDVSEEDIAVALRFRAHAPSFIEHAAREITAARPAIVGFTTAFNQTLASLALATRLRERLGDDVRIVFGGANCEGSMGAALHRAFPVIDVVVRGEGERVLPELANDLLARRPVHPRPGLCYRDADGLQVAIEQGPGDVPLDDVPLPRYEEYFERLARMSFRDAVDPKVTLFYESARGCWWGERSQCVFCGISDLGMPFRAKRPERVVSELVELAERYGRLRFFFVDYILNREYFDDVLPALRELGYDLEIFCETKANLRRDQVRLLHDAGFTVIQAGVESLSTPVLKLMRKGVTALQNVRLLKWCAEYDVRLIWNVLYGIPGEPPEEYVRMAELIPSLTHLEPPRLVPLELDRFSPYFERPGEYGILPRGPRRDLRFVYPAHVDDATLTELVYAFAFDYADGRDPEEYTAACQAAVRRWQSRGRSAIGTLRYRRGPGFLTVTDRRPGLEPAEYRLGETEARIYLACENGATVAAVCEEVPERPREDVEAFLAELVETRLACAIDGRYLALALPVGPRQSTSASSTKVARVAAATLAT